MSSALITKLKKLIPIPPPPIPVITVDPPPPSAPRPPFQNGSPESLRMALVKCPITVINSEEVNNQPLVAIANTSQPSSNTTLRRRDLTLTQADNPYDPTTRFTDFYPPTVPPPQFLQVPRYRDSNEPKSRVTPCVGPRRVDASYS